MNRTSHQRRLAALALLAIGAGQLVAPAAEARLWLDNGVGLNGLRLNGANLNGTGERNLGARGLAATAPSRADAGQLRLRAIRLAVGG
jgi:hypothetical protein